MKARQVRRALLRHGPVDDARQAHELRGRPDAGRGDERLHQVRGHADARPRQRHRRGRGHALDDRLSLRRQPVPRLPALQSRRVLDRGPAGPRRRATPRSSSAPTPARRCRSRPSTTWPASRPSCWTRRSRTPAGWPASTSRRRSRASARPGPSTAWTRFRCRCGRRSKSPYPTDEEVVRRINAGGRGESPCWLARCEASAPDDRRNRRRSMLRITGGKVYDPANGINGVIKDICIADGRDRRRRGQAAARSTRPAWSSSPAAWTSTPTSPAPPSTSPAP